MSDSLQLTSLKQFNKMLAFMAAVPNRDLLEEFTQLVGGGVLTEAEFWISKAKQTTQAPSTANSMLGHATLSVGKKTGISNKMLEFQVKL